MRSFIFGTAFALVVATGSVAFAQNSAWGDAANGYGKYHESNGASTGWGDASNGNGYYHESNGAAKPHQQQTANSPQPTGN